MSNRVDIDVLIMGGGIAGLWTLARLHQAGYRCMLLERLALGAGQTIASQGIIHGGVKYALGPGGHTDASKAIAQMPEVWRRCLAGEGEIDLRSVEMLSRHQHLWTAPGLLGKLGGLGATLAMRADVRSVDGERRPEVLRSAPRSVSVYEVDEPVLDSWSVVEAIAGRHGAWCVRPRGIERLEASMDGQGRVKSVVVHAGGGHGETHIAPRAVVCAAGEGNDQLRSIFGGPVTHVPQVRPLHMVMMRGAPGPLFAHCVGASTLPHLTVTSGRDARGSGGGWVWYLGGAIAEGEGVERDERAQIAAARSALKDLLGWVDTRECAFATCRWNRAEGVPRSQHSARRPEGPTVERTSGGNVVYVWPTKLAFAPLAAERVARELADAGIAPSRGRGEAEEPMEWPSALERAPIGPRPWEGRMVVSADGVPMTQDVRWTTARSATQD